MTSGFTTALLISTYNWPQALKLVLDSILHQTILPDEILIADDGSDELTKQLIDSYRQKLTIPIKHFWHEHRGFRKTIIVNRAVAGTACDYIIEIDGDIILHKRFIEDHIHVAEPGYYIRGSRLSIQEKASTRALHSGVLSSVSPFSRGVSNRFNGLRIPFLSHFLIKKSSRSRNFRGCNCAFWRTDFIHVNGYNSEMHGWGHEDIELAARFINAGILQKKVKLLAVCYHIYHETLDKKHETTNFTIYTATLVQGIRRCTMGYSNNTEQFN